LILQAARGAQSCFGSLNATRTTSAFQSLHFVEMASRNVITLTRIMDCGPTCFIFKSDDSSNVLPHHRHEIVHIMRRWNRAISDDVENRLTF